MANLWGSTWTISVPCNTGYRLGRMGSAHTETVVEVGQALCIRRSCYRTAGWRDSMLTFECWDSHSMCSSPGMRNHPGSTCRSSIWHSAPCPCLTCSTVRPQRSIHLHIRSAWDSKSSDLCCTPTLLRSTVRHNTFWGRHSTDCHPDRHSRSKGSRSSPRLRSMCDSCHLGSIHRRNMGRSSCREIGMQYGF